MARKRRVCSACRFWTERKDPDPPFGSCLNEKFVDICKRSGRDEIEDGLADGSITDDSLCYADRDAYGAWFITGKNFGCIHFERGGER